MTIYPIEHTVLVKQSEIISLKSSIINYFLKFMPEIKNTPK